MDRGILLYFNNVFTFVMQTGLVKIQKDNNAIAWPEDTFISIFWLCWCHCVFMCRILISIHITHYNPK